MKTWYHFLPISLLIHAGLFALAQNCVQDDPAHQRFAIEREQERRTAYFPMPANITDDSNRAAEGEEAVSPDEDPFAEQPADIVQPEIAFRDEMLDEPEKEATVQENDISQRDEAADGRVPAEPQTADQGDSESRDPTAPPASAQQDAGTHGSASPGSPAQNSGSAAPSPSHRTGTGTVAANAVRIDETKLWQDYTRTLSNHFRKHKHYPETARRMRITGTVWIMLEISRDGSILSAEVAESSGSDILDEAALRSARSAGPVPAFPPQTAAQTKKLRIPYSYKLR